MTITVPVTLRSGLGRALTIAEGDANFSGLADGISQAGEQIDLAASNLANTSDFSKGAFSIGRGYPVLDSISALRSCLKTGVANRVFVTGYYASGDGGGGPYYYDSSDTTSSDNGGSIIVAGDGGRWKLVHQGIFYAEQFGAKGDWNGTTGTDDAAALQAAINALPATGGRIGLRWGKRYLIGSQIAVAGTGHIEIFGAGGAEASNNVGASEIIKAGTMTAAALNITSPFAKMRDFVLRGATSNTGDGIQISANSVTLDHVSVFSMGQDGVRVGLDSGINSNSWFFIGCKFSSNTRFGAYFSDQVSPTLPNSSGGTWINCLAQSNGNDGVRLGNTTLNSFFGGVVENNGGCGVRINGTGANFNTIVGMDFDSGNAAGKLRIESGAVYNRIEAATLYDTDIVDLGTKTYLSVPNSSNAGNYVSGMFQMDFARGGSNILRANASGGYLTFFANADSTSDSNAHLIVGSDGLHLGKSSGGKIGAYGATPIVQPATGGTSSTFVANSGTAINSASTFDGYTLAQVVKALRNLGFLA
jgi:hypothetical protein